MYTSEREKRDADFRNTHEIVGEFEHDGHIYFLYHRNEVDRAVYITGHALDWERGLKYDDHIKHIIQVQYISDDLRKKIIRAMK